MNLVIDVPPGVSLAGDEQKVHAAIGTEKTSSIATRHGAFAAINAGFFRLDTSIWAGDSAGVLKIDEQLLSESNNTRIALLIRNLAEKTNLKIGNFDSRMTFTFQHRPFEFEG